MKKIKYLFIFLSMLCIGVFCSCNNKNHTHNWIEVTTYNSTCTKEGLRIFNCDGCEETYEEKIQAKGHKEVVEQKVEPTCTTTGLTEGSYCSICKETIVEREVIPALGHSIEYLEALEATCTTTGLTKGSYCTRCDVIIDAQKVVKAKGHTIVEDKAVAATCTSTGLTRGTHCGVCKEILLRQNITNKLPHIEVIDESVEATCTTTGLTKGLHCSICETILLSQETIDIKPENHDYQNYICNRCQDNWYTEGLMFTYESGEYIVSEYNGDDETVVIPALYEKKSVKGIGENVFKNNTKIKQIIILGEIIEIGDEAFENCSSLTKINLPSSLKKIGERAFVGCENLLYNTFEGGIYLGNEENPYVVFMSVVDKTDNEYIINQQTKVVYDYAFQYASQVQKIEIPESVVSIGNYVFDNCSILEELIISNNVKNYGYSILQNCRNLNKLILPLSGRLSDGNHGFGYLFGGAEISDNNYSVPSSLKEVVITSGTIKKRFFSSCSKIDKFVIETGVSKIEDLAFHGTAMTSFTTSIIPEYFGQLFGELEVYPNYQTYKDYYLYVPSSLKEVNIIGVSSIGSYAFYNCKNITTLYISKTVKNIQSTAFYNCAGLEKIIVDSENTTYDSRNNCNAIVSTSSNRLVVGSNNTILPDEIVTIGKYAFSNRTKFDCVNLPSSLTTIEDYSFLNCGVVNVIIPDSVTNIGIGIFVNCSYLETIGLPEGIKVIRQQMFKNCISLKEFIIPETVTTIEKQALYNCDGLDGLYIPETVTYIEEGALYSCDSKVLTLPFVGDELNSGKNNRFSYVFEVNGEADIPYFEEVTIVNGIIEKSAFDNVKINTLILGDKVKRIEDYAFKYVTLDKLIIGSGVIYVERGFGGLINTLIIDEDNPIYDSRDGSNAVIETLTNTLVCGLYCDTIPYGVETIGEAAFYNGKIGYYSGTVVLPDSVIQIDDHAFWNWRDVDGIEIPDSVILAGAAINGHDWEAGMDPDESTFMGQNHVIMTEFVGYSDDWRQYYVSIASEGAFSTRRYPQYSHYYRQYDNALYFGSYDNPYLILVTAVNEEITSCNIHADAKYIEYSAFSSCKKLETVTFPEGLLSIGSNAFYNCTSLTNITFPESLLRISSEAFGSCTSLTEIYIPKNVIRIVDNPFRNCLNVTSIVVDSENPYYNSNNNCNAIIKTANNILLTGCKNSIIPEGITTIGSYAFSSIKFTNKTIQIPSGVLVIESCAFVDSTMDHLELPEGLIKIGSNAFCYTKLKTITIPKSVKYIGDRALFNYTTTSINYYGSEQEWARVFVNESNKLEDATIVYNYEPPVLKTFTFNYYNSSNWNNVYAYVYINDTPLVSWPGTLMTKEGDNWYSYQLDEYSLSGYKIIFNNGGSIETSSISLIDEELFFSGMNSISFKSKEEALSNANSNINQYSVIGTGFDGSGSWDKDIIMTLNSTGSYEATIVVSSSAQFKIRVNKSWNENYGGTLQNGSVTGVSNGANISLSSSGTYLITFNPSNKKITVTKI